MVTIDEFSPFNAGAVAVTVVVRDGESEGAIDGALVEESGLDGPEDGMRLGLKDSAIRGALLGVRLG